MNVEKLKLAWTPCTYVHCSSFIMTRVFITCLASHWKTHRQTLVTTADVPADIPRRRHLPPPEDTLKAAAAKKSFQTLASAKMHSPAWLLTSFYCKMSNCNLDHREDLSRLEFWFQKIRNSLLFFKAKTNQNPDAGFVFDRSMVLCFHVTNFHESFSSLGGFWCLFIHSLKIHFQF